MNHFKPFLFFQNHVNIRNPGSDGQPEINHPQL